MRDLSVSLNKVGDVAQAQEDWRRAGEAFEESLSIRRTLRERVGDTPQALRDLSVSLNKVGDVAQAQEDWRRAGEAFEESLSIRRTSRERVGDTPQALRDLSISLERVGDAARNLQDFPRAAAAYRECLELLTRQKHVFPESFEFGPWRQRLEHLLEELPDVDDDAS